MDEIHRGTVFLPWRCCRMAFATLVCVVCVWFNTLQAKQQKEVFLPIELFEPAGRCKWKPLAPMGVNFYGNNRWSPLFFYIERPAEGQNRKTWLAKLREYRRHIRDGGYPRALDINLNGIDDCVRLALPIARAYDLEAGESLNITINAHWIEAKNKLCLAFEIYDLNDNTMVGRSPVCATLTIPKDGQWHQVTAEVEVPQFDSARQWLRPVFGVCDVHERTYGRMEISSIGLQLDDSTRMNVVDNAIQNHVIKKADPLDRTPYGRADLKWAAKTYACHFTFMFDRSLYDPATGRYTLDVLLDDGLAEFGGYDMILLWQAYPRLGVDDRNQFDFYRDMPGGLEGIRDLVHRAHERGVKVSIDYNPWDRGTRREGKSDEDALAELVAATEVDGIFLDTMGGGSTGLRDKINQARPGVVFVPEGFPGSLDQLSVCNGSWAQGQIDLHPPGLQHLKWIEPRHMHYQIRRWQHSHQQEIETAFFNGTGMLIWENIFGTYNPWPIEDRMTWRRAVAVLRHFAENFTSDGWDPFYPTLIRSLFANRWPDSDVTVFTLLNYGRPIRNAALLEVPSCDETQYYDLWNGRPLKVEPTGRGVKLISSIDRIGCILAVKKAGIDQSLKDLLKRQRREARRKFPDTDVRNFASSVVEPEQVEKTKPVARNQQIPGMVFVPGGTVRMHIKHRARECGCYPDPGTPKEKRPNFLFGWSMGGIHDYTVKLQPFFIDETEVTNAGFRRFLDSTGYRPKHLENFLKHWSDGQMPPELAGHPVVYVDIDDARAYAKWAGKRLPTEPEWHLAAQGTDERTWPWGNEFDTNRCNTTGDRTMPVRSCPTGRSPYGCYHMSGNVWEWTESCRDDGHTRFVIIRGGSYFDAKGSSWYVSGGPKPCNHHAKFIRMWPGLDRCATIGFRCVVDTKR